VEECGGDHIPGGAVERVEEEDPHTEEYFLSPHI
jgi:hypothetical protein